MEDKPVEALRRKRDNSISKCWNLLASGEVDAVVSAGHTGAMVASALMNAKMFLPGVRRPGIAAIFPSHQGPIVIIDVGANMNAKAEDLYQYGIMGSIYAEHVLGIADPKIGLMNVGSEDDKGTDLIRATRALFQNGVMASRFHGNVEGRDIYEGHARVIVCEGFVGNVLLKAGEGAVEFLFNALKQELGKLMPELGPEVGGKIAASFKELKTRFEYAGVRRRAFARPPGGLHHLPRVVGVEGDPERAPGGRDDGRGAGQRRVGRPVDGGRGRVAGGLRDR